MMPPEGAFGTVQPDEVAVPGEQEAWSYDIWATIDAWITERHTARDGETERRTP